MAGYRRIYCIGGLGGFQGADGLNPIEFQILVGQGDRFWMKPHYFNKKIKPIGKISRIIPSRTDLPSSLIDACIAFAPNYFQKCKSLEKVSGILSETQVLDFDMSPDDIPAQWKDLREEATEYFEKLNIFQGNLSELEADKKYPASLGDMPSGF